MFNEINYHLFKQKVVLVAQLCPTLCNPMGCSLPGSSLHGILQARTLEWVATPFPKGSSCPGVLNLGLLHCRHILYHLSQNGEIYILSTIINNSSKKKIFEY